MKKVEEWSGNENSLLSFDERECEWKGRFSATNLTSETLAECLD